MRHLRLGCERLVFPPAQLELFVDRRRLSANRRRLAGTVDRIRERFGRQAIGMGRVLALNASCPQP